MLHDHSSLFLQKKLRKDPESVKPQAAATIVGGKRPPLASSRAPLCELPAQVLASEYLFFLKTIKCSERVLQHYIL